MKIKFLRLANFVLVPVLLTLLFFTGNMITSGGEYDPWIDYDETGTIDIFDAINLANAFGTSGNPTKQCNITNWPISDDICVFWGYNLIPSHVVVSAHYEASGFGQLHVLAQGNYLGAGESVKIEIIGILHNPAHTGYLYIPGYTLTLTQGSIYRVFTIPTPSESFAFRASTDAVSDCEIYLSFYLTWA